MNKQLAEKIADAVEAHGLGTDTEAYVMAIVKATAEWAAQLAVKQAAAYDELSVPWGRTMAIAAYIREGADIGGVE